MSLIQTVYQYDTHEETVTWTSEWQFFKSCKEQSFWEGRR